MKVFKLFVSAAVLMSVASVEGQLQDTLMIATPECCCGGRVDSHGDCHIAISRGAHSERYFWERSLALACHVLESSSDGDVVRDDGCSQYPCL